MSTPTLYQASNIAGVLDELTTLMGIENKLGTEEEVRTGTPPRIVWVPETGKRSYSATIQQRTDVKHVREVNPRFQVHIWARDYAEAERLEAALEKALYAKFSGNAYTWSDGEQKAGDAAQRGYEFIIPVQLLKVPLAVAVFQRVTLVTQTAQGEIANAAGADPEDAGTIVVPQ